MSYIERDAFLAEQRHLYCENCARRKNGKGKFVYDIGDAPCRACGYGDVLDDVENAPAADLRPVVLCRDCRHRDPEDHKCDCGEMERQGCPFKIDPFKARLDNCPLVPVPPHGRLIDADALREDWLENGENEYVYDTNAFLDSLDAAPTIIPAEEGTDFYTKGHLHLGYAEEGE